jgi:hypothetical protein
MSASGTLHNGYTDDIDQRNLEIQVTGTLDGRANDAQLRVP